MLCILYISAFLKFDICNHQRGCQHFLSIFLWSAWWQLL